MEFDTMNDIWMRVMDNVETHVFPHLRYHSIVAKEIAFILSDKNDTATNILLYGPHGFPMNIIWDSLFPRSIKRQIVWNNQVTYLETPHFFEIDVAYPHNPKDIDTLAWFIKELIQHPCVFNTRHVIIINNIDYICSLHNGKQSYAFRVLLERFSQNAVFICTTCNRAHLEQPLLSRFIGFRIPLATTAELQNIFESLQIPFHPMIVEYNCRDLYFAMYIAWLSLHAPSKIKPDMFKYKVSDMHALVASGKKVSHADIRDITSHVSVHNASMRDITLDIIHDIKCEKKKQELIMYAAKIDHMCATTESFRKPLYIELLINIATYGLGDTEYMSKLSLGFT